MNTDYAQCTNVGGIRKLTIVADDGFLAKPENGEWSVISIKPDAVVFDVLFAPNTCSLSEGEQLTEQGLLILGQVAASVPKLTKEFRSFLYINAERRWVVFAEDNNGLTHILGEPEVGLKLNVNSSIGGVGSSRNTNDIALSGSMIFPPFISETMITLEGPTIDLRSYAQQNFIAYKGDSINQELTFEDANGVIETLTGSSFLMQVKDNAGNVIFSFDMGSGFSLQSLDTVLNMTKTASEMAAVAVGKYSYDLQRTFPDASVNTVMKGYFIIENDVTL